MVVKPIFSLSSMSSNSHNPLNLPWDGDTHTFISEVGEPLLPTADINSPAYAVVNQQTNQLETAKLPFPQSKHNLVHPVVNPTGNLNAPTEEDLQQLPKYVNEAQAGAMLRALDEYEEQYIVSARQCAPSFKPDKARIGLNVPYLKLAAYNLSLDGEAVSFVDLVDHTYSQIVEYARQDEILQEDEKEKVDHKAVIEAANKQWRDAIAMRKKVIAEWDEYVAQCRKIYKDAKAIAGQK